MQAYVIHLKSAADRWQQVERLMRQMPVQCRVLDAVAGAQLSDRDVEAAYRRTIHWPPYPFRLSRGEIGCFLSHRLSWRAISDGRDEGGLVIEDDVEVDMARLPAALELVNRYASRGDIIRFPNKFRSSAGEVVAAANGLQIVREKSPGLNMMMQWIGRDAARALLASTEAFDRPVDVFVQMRWLHRLPVYALRPVLIREISGQLGGSTIQASNKSIVREVARGVTRTAYRGFTRARNLFD